jgi:hypothetical protein
MRFKFPWTERAEREAIRRREAEKRLHDIKADWLELDPAVRAVHREIELNQWTRTAKAIFGGRQ